MIARISGTLIKRDELSVVIDVGGLAYEVLVPHIVGKALEAKPLGEPLVLETIYYLAVEQTRATPILIGFQNAIEKEFFQKLVEGRGISCGGNVVAVATPHRRLSIPDGGNSENCWFRHDVSLLR